MRLEIDGWTFVRRRPGWWAAVSPQGDEFGPGGFRQVVIRALGRMPTAPELSAALGLAK